MNEWINEKVVFVRESLTHVPPHLAQPCCVALGQALIQGLYKDLAFTASDAKAYLTAGDTTYGSI